MKYFFLVVGLWAFWFTPAWSDEGKIQTTIQLQIEAFQRDDLIAAFEYASPNIQTIFKSSKRFGLMVQRGYPMVYRPSDIKFLELETIEGEFWQKVRIQDQQGRFHVMAYRMISLDGKWLINGVQLLPSEEIGV
jgi:hypothetical protein|tara:strand:+ start:85 stop:486 length:402 start_codon:yes stop_codon:yes gene_type:complete